MDEVLKLLRENNAMLRKITSYIRKIQGQAYRQNEDMRAFAINVCADVFVEAMEEPEKDNLNNLMRNENI